ncbi:MAG TPA: serine/threonine-protein kinase [Thermoanaerobaculia bacterium]
MDEQRVCPQCGGPLAADAPAGQCPQCLLLLGIGEDTAGVDETMSALAGAGGEPEWIGPYRLLDKIGEGGMGVVYLAEQEKPIRRRVAVKVVKLGMDTAQVIARFESERQALALMSHPNVARVYDAGATPNGRPYFVMEYVAGLPITDYCDQHRLSIHERLRLFVEACEAIQHAHQKGIIHRDVKPSNVLVAMEEGRPVVKVIDFGVAKAVDQRLTERTLFTHFGLLVGTPEFMSPEQAEAGAVGVDTRTDVYSLGVLLYALVTGTLPFTAESLREAGYAEMRRLIREEEPPRPSTRLASLGDAATAARVRGTDPGTLVRELRGDLDWIVMKAIEKEPGRRYGSPSELAAEIARHLANEPVLARPPSAVYKVGKLVRRHRLAMAAAAAVVLALVGGAALATWQAVRATRAERLARAEAETARQVADFLVGLFEVSDPAVAQGETLTAREILDRGRARIAGSLAGEPRVKARLLGVIGEIYGKLGLFADAGELLDEALAMRERLLADGGSDGGDEGDLELARDLHRLGRLRGDAGDDAAAEPLLVRSLDLFAARAGEGDPEWAAVAADLAEVERRTGRFAEAVARQERVLAAFEAAAGRDDPRVGGALASLGTLAYEQGDFVTAEARFREALAVRERTLGESHPDVAQNLSRLGSALGRLGRSEEEEAMHLRALAVFRKVYGERHSTVAEALTNLGGLYGRLGRLPEAEATLREAVRVYGDVFGPEHVRCGIALKNLAQALVLQGKLADAEPVLLRSLALDEKGHGPEHFWTGASHRTLADLYRRQARWAEAAEHYERALAVVAPAVGEEHFEVAQILKGRARVALHQGRPGDAEADARRALAIAEKGTGERSPAVGEALETVGEVLVARGEHGEAIAALERALAIHAERLPPGHPTTADALRLLADASRGAGDADEAEALYRRSLAVAEAAHGPEHLDVADALAGLAGLLAERGDGAAARPLAERAAAIRRARLGAAHPDTRTADALVRRLAPIAA